MTLPSSRRPPRTSRFTRPIQSIILAALVILLAGEAFLVWAYEIVDRSGPPMLIASRRGDLAHWPENTFEGILSARDLGADGIEFDVRRSADGTFFLMHDATVDRTTTGSGPILLMTDAEVAALRIDGGLGYSGQHGLGVPTLAEVLAELGEFPGLILLDAKGDAAEHAALAELVLDRGLADRAWISCYDEDQTRAVRAAGAVTTYGGRQAHVDLAMETSPLGLLSVLSPPKVTAIMETWTGAEVAPMERARRWGCSSTSPTTCRAPKDATDADR